MNEGGPDGWFCLPRLPQISLSRHKNGTALWVSPLINAFIRPRCKNGGSCIPLTQVAADDLFQQQLSVFRAVESDIF